MPRGHGTHRTLPAYDLAVRAASGLIDHADRRDLDPIVEKIRHYRQVENWPEFWSRHLKIRTKQAEHVPFKLNRAQRFVWETTIRPGLESGDTTWLYLIKGRQMGWTTLLQAIGYTIGSLWPDVHAFTGAHDEKSVRKIFEITKLFYKLSPADFRPTQKISNRIELQFANPSDVGDLGLESFLTIAPATSENLGASQTLQFAHLSEFCLYDQRSVDVPAMMATFLATIAEGPRSLVVLESTARQGYGKDLWEDESSSFTKLFVSWIGDEEYRDPIPLEADQVSGDSRSKYGDEARARELILSELRFWYPEHQDDPAWYRHESLCRLAWRRRKIDAVARDGGLTLFRREYPLTADEAFETSGAGVFDALVLSEQKQAAQERLLESPPAYYSWDATAPRVAMADGVPSRLIRKDLAEQLDATGGIEDLDGLLVYERPHRGERYIMAADSGGGYAKSDPSTISIHRVGQKDDRGRTFQCAVFRSRIGPIELARVADELGRWYHNAHAIPEANGLGQGFVDELVHRLHYPSVFLRTQYDETTQTFSDKIGFSTSSVTKPLLISRHQDALRNRRCVLRDLASIAEHLAYTAEERGRQQVFTAPRGMHDDLVMADALVTFAHSFVPAPAPRKAREHRWWKDAPVVAGVKTRMRGERRAASASMF